DLFAKATEAAVKPNGEQELKALFAQYSDTGTNQAENREREHAANSNTTGGTGATSGGTSGLSARAGSNSNNGSSSGSNNNANERNSPGSANATSGRNTNEASGSNHMANQQALNQTIQQFQQDWKQKYGSDFTIQNPALVFADISATDITPGQAQTAGQRIGGSASSGNTGNANE